MKERADKNAAWASFHKANALTGGRFKLLPSDLCGPCGALKIPYAVEGVEDPLFTPHLPLSQFLETVRGGNRGRVTGNCRPPHGGGAGLRAGWQSREARWRALRKKEVIGRSPRPGWRSFFINYDYYLLSNRVACPASPNIFMFLVPCCLFLVSCALFLSPWLGVWWQEVLWRWFGGCLGGLIK